MEGVAVMDAMLWTRMHACILAMIAGVPCVNIEYEFKSRELFERLRLADLVVAIDNFAPREVAAKLNWLLDNRTALSERIRSGVAGLRLINSAAADRIASDTGQPVAGS
jgi:polysaccharide pyruvyl transferase WcaK-like protein